MFRFDEQDGIARLAIGRPEARGAIPAEGWSELAALARRAAASDAYLFLLEGSDGAFCAGADLAGFATLRGEPAAAARLREDMAAATAALAALPMPSIARVDGPCYGAGVALALACDLRSAGPRARFAITPAKLGVGYPQADIRRLVALVGPGMAARLLFTAESLDGPAALAAGLVEQAGGAAEFEAFAAAILAGSPASHRHLKRALSAAGPDPALDADFDALLAGDEVAERLAARRP